MARDLKLDVEPPAPAPAGPATRALTYQSCAVTPAVAAALPAPPVAIPAPPPRPQGPQGNPGPPGSTGPAGPQGLPGPAGDTGPTGAQGPQGIPGPPGPQGDPGEAGEPGPVGPPGAPGAAGAAGVPGPQGEPGERGEDGIPGATGPTGATGAQGPIGPQGEPGDQGETGPQGPPGPTGADGLAGARGADGERGDDGVDAPVIPGPPGPQGPQGPPGPPGADGEKGDTGDPGPPGPPGATGPAGVAGAITSTQTISLGSTPALSGTFDITGLTGLTIGVPVPVMLAVDPTDPTSAEEQIAVSGITTSSSTISCYWQSVDGTPKSGSRSVLFITAGSVGFAVGSGNAITVSTQVDLTGSTSTINITPTSGALGVVDISTLKCGGVLTFQNVSEATINGFTAPANDGFWFVCHVRDATSSFVIKLLEDAGTPATTGIRTPDIRDLRLYKNDSVMLIYSNGRWRACAPMTRMFLTGVEITTLAATENDHARPSAGQNHLRFTLTGDQQLTGLVPDQSTNGSPNGEIVAISNIDTADTLTIPHESTSTVAAGNRFTLPNAKAYILQPRTTGLFHYDDTTGRWRALTPPPAGMLHRDIRTSTGAWLVDLNPGTTWLRIIAQGGGGGGGGAQNAVALEATAGAGGAAGGYFDVWVQTVSSATQVTGSVGNGGNGGSNAGGNGSPGGNTTVTYNGVTRTAFGGGGGLGIVSGAGAVNGGQLVRFSTPGQGGDTDQTDFEIQMGDGFPGLMYAGAALTSCMAIGGNGGPSFFGAGCVGAMLAGVASNASPVARGAYGSGGAGAATIRQTAGAAAGAAGGGGIAGIIIIEQWAGLTPTTVIS